MSKLHSLDLRTVTQRKLARREICEIVMPIIPDVPVRSETKHSYAKRQGFLRHLISYVVR